LIEALSGRLIKEFGKGFQARNLWWMRDFYLKFPILNAMRSELTWTHYRLLLKVEDAEARFLRDRGRRGQLVNAAIGAADRHAVLRARGAFQTQTGDARQRARAI